jgi:hypothetical protein
MNRIVICIVICHGFIKHTRARGVITLTPHPLYYTTSHTHTHTQGMIGVTLNVEAFTQTDEEAIATAGQKNIAVPGKPAFSFE